MRNLGLLGLALLAASASAKPVRPATKAPPVSKVEPSKAPEPEVASAELITRMQALYGALEYDQVLPLADAALARTDLSLEQRLEVYRLQGSARAIVLDPLEAESPFRLLLRARADYELPAGTTPKIMAVFRKVQAEERAFAQTLREVERAQLIAKLSLTGEPKSPAVGGKPLLFSFRLKDPSGTVEAVRVPYRRQTDRDWSTLALRLTEAGSWDATLSSEVTANERGFVLEYYVETADAEGVLLTRGTSLLPQHIEVTPGVVLVERFKPIPRAAFITSASLTVSLGIAATVLGILFQFKQAEYGRLLSPPSRDDIVDGDRLKLVRTEGEALAGATTGILIATGAGLLMTGVMLPLTKFAAE